MRDAIALQARARSPARPAASCGGSKARRATSDQGRRHADHRAPTSRPRTLIIARLSEAWPGIPVVAEETANAQSPDDVFFLVDPLDGTGDFIHGTGEYSVNIALSRPAGRSPRGRGTGAGPDLDRRRDGSRAGDRRRTRAAVLGAGRGCGPRPGRTCRPRQPSARGRARRRPAWRRSRSGRGAPPPRP